MSGTARKNPYESTGRAGKGGFWRTGELEMADAIVTATFKGARHLLMVERRDGHGWAVPGGHVEPGENPLIAAVRELREETGLSLTPEPGGWVDTTGLPKRHVPDPRQTDDAWAVTTPIAIDLGTVTALPPVAGGDDARRAEWVPAPDYAGLATALILSLRGTVFPAHIPMLREFLDGAS